MKELQAKTLFEFYEGMVVYIDGKRYRLKDMTIPILGKSEGSDSFILEDDCGLTHFEYCINIFTISPKEKDLNVKKE